MPFARRSSRSGFDGKSLKAISWMLPCPRRRPTHPAIAYGAICHACPAIPSTVNHDGREPAPPSSRKIPLSFSTQLPDGVFDTHNWPHPPCGSAYRLAHPSTARLPRVALPTMRFNQRGQPRSMSARTSSDSNRGETIDWVGSSLAPTDPSVLAGVHGPTTAHLICDAAAALSARAGPHPVILHSIA